MNPTEKDLLRERGAGIAEGILGPTEAPKPLAERWAAKLAEEAARHAKKWGRR